MTAPIQHFTFPNTDVFNQGNKPGDGPLRIGGQSASQPGPSPEEDLPSTESECVEKQMPALAIVRDLEAGPEAVRAAEDTYLPKAFGEDARNYKTRLERSPFFNIFGHTIKGLVGQVFRRDPRLGDDVPESIRQHAENIDLAGTHFDVFARQLLQDGLVAGHAGILVEFPKTGGQQHAGQEMTSAIRPYWVPIRKDDIVSFRTAIVDGHEILTQLVLEERTMVPLGLFGEQEQTRYRVLYNQNGVVGFQLLQITDNKQVVLVDEGLYPTQDEIPFAEVQTSGKRGTLNSQPPLLDLAYLNIAYYQQYSDYMWSIHKTCVPILALIGVQVKAGESEIVVGANSAFNLPLHGDAKYVSHTGQALDKCKQALDDLKSDMGTLGLAMLSPQKRTAETAQAKRLDKATEDAALAVTARGLEDGLERALQFHAKYLRLPTGGSVSINREFDEQSMQADMLTAWANAVKQAGVPERLMLEAMQAGGLIDPDEDVEGIADEMMASRAAQQAEADAQAAATMDALKSKATPPTAGGAMAA